MTSTPVLRVDLASPVPVYRQVASALRALLVAGELAAGDQLPTIRQLAVDLDVHRNTIAEAYRLLAGEGWLELRRRHGAMVLAREVPHPGAEVAANFARRLRELVAESLASGLARETASELLDEAARSLLDGGDAGAGA